MHMSGVREDFTAWGQKLGIWEASAQPTTKGL